MTEARPKGDGAAPMALDNLRVIDAAHVIAGPVGATFMGEFGAEVIKVELPGVGEDARRNGPTYNGLSFLWVVENRNKKSITLDLRQPEGRRIFKELVACSDVLFENFRPGIMEGWGLGYEELSQVNPGLIMVRVSGFGQTGPLRHKAGYDRVAVGVAGLTYVTGFPDRPPVRPAFSVADYATGTLACLGAMFALYYRDARRAGKGQYIDIALYESIFRYAERLLPLYDKRGIVQERIGNTSHAAAPAETFHTGDGKWMSMVVLGDRQFERVAKAIGREDWLHNPRYITPQDRARHAREINEDTARWVGQHTLQEVLDVLETAEIAAGPIYSIADIVEDPQYAARENIVEIEDPVMGPVKVPNVVPKLSLTPGSVRAPAPLLGQHNEEVYCGLLGYSKGELARLQEAGIV